MDNLILVLVFLITILSVLAIAGWIANVLGWE
jgi:hypothetical protein